MVGLDKEVLANNWRVIESIDTTNMVYSQAKPAVENLIEKYLQQGYHVRVHARSIIEIQVPTDA